MTKHMYFTPFVGDQFEVKPNTSREGRVEVVSEMCEDSVSLVLERTDAVAAALHMIACALGEAAALDAERAIAPHMRVSKP